MTPQEKLNLFWDKYRIYAINPNKLFNQEDFIHDFVQSKQDVFKITMPLGIPYNPRLTFGRIFQLIGIWN